MTGTTLRRIASVSAEPRYRLRIVWRDGETDTVDMTGVVRGLNLFAPLRDPAAFARVVVIDHGSGIEWSNGLDYSSDSLAHLAAEQSDMSGADFRRWQAEMGLSLQETADLFGWSLSTVKSYRRARALPIAVQIACRAMHRDRDTFLARYRPRVAGRPHKSAA
jgi:hypothetical protein